MLFTRLIPARSGRGLEWIAQIISGNGRIERLKIFIRHFRYGGVDRYTADGKVSGCRVSEIQSDTGDRTVTVDIFSDNSQRHTFCRRSEERRVGKECRCEQRL